MNKANWIWVAALGAGLVLSGCANREIILPGKREVPRAVLADADVLAERDAVPENRALPISLPAQRHNADWAQRPVSPLYRTAHPALGPGLALQWTADIGQGDTRRQRLTADPVVAGGRVFTLDAHAHVTATSTGGQELWSRDLTPMRDGRTDTGGGGLAYGDGQVFVTSAFGTLTALDAATGRENWRQALGAAATGMPAYHKGLVYLVAGDSTAWAVEADTGRVRWQTDSVQNVSNVLGGPAPALTDKAVIFAFGSGEVRAALRQGGLGLWAATVVGARENRAISRISDITGDPVVDGDRVFVGNHSGRLVALGRDNGDRIWTAREGALGPVWPAGGSIFAVTDLNELVRFDASDGSRIWGVRLPGFVKDNPRRRAEMFAHYGPILAGGRLIVASNDGLIRQFDPRDGRLIGTTEVPGGATTNPVVAGGTLYVVGTKGQLHAFR